jgi:non-specific serine/threonine protein kinase
LLARFSHPAMVKVYRFWEANGTAYMVMPYLRGPTLKDVRSSMSEPPTEAWLRSVVEPLLDALAMLHAEGIYHRDIAPDNVVLTGAGLPVLLDFGAARHLIGDRTQSLTAVLKPNFAPIEQYAESKQLRQGPWTDLYALGALVAYLLDGVPPPASTARAIHDEMEALGERRIADVSPAFLAAFDWALAVRPQDRPQSVAELRSALSGRMVEKTIQMPRPATPARPVAVLPRLAAVVGLITLAVALASGWFSPGKVALATSAPAALEPAAHVAAAPLPSDETVSFPTSPVPVAMSSSALPAEVAEASPAQGPKLRGRPESIARVRDSGMKTRAPVPAKSSHERKARRIQVASRGPMELCAAHNFFMRAFCVRRRCDEPRFKAHPQCVQTRQAEARRRD